MKHLALWALGCALSTCPTQAAPAESKLDAKTISELDYYRQYVCPPHGSDNFSGEAFAKSRHLKPFDVSDAMHVTAGAEAIFDQVYGRALMKGEKPLRTYLYKNEWYVLGTLPHRYDKGGVGVMVISAHTGEVTCLFHQQ